MLNPTLLTFNLGRSPVKNAVRVGVTVVVEVVKVTNKVGLVGEAKVVRRS